MPRQYTPRVPVPCNACGRLLMVMPYRLRRHEKHYCSRVCYFAPPRLELSEDKTVAFVPLKSKNGTTLSFAIIDATDIEWVGRWTWGLHAGYAARNSREAGNKRRTILLHRELLGISYWSGLEGDHVDRDPLNCRNSNLRIVTHGENMQNRSVSDKFSSKHRGVSWRDGKWRAQIAVNGKHLHLGVFADENAAALVALEARRKMLPFAVN